MLCPRKFGLIIYNYEYQNEKGYKTTETVYPIYTCDKEKCAWWIPCLDVKEVDEEKKSITLETSGDCAMKIIALGLNGDC